LLLQKHGETGVFDSELGSWDQRLVTGKTVTDMMALIQSNIYSQNTMQIQDRHINENSLWFTTGYKDW